MVLHRPIECTAFIGLSLTDAGLVRPFDERQRQVQHEIPNCTMAAAGYLVRVGGGLFLVAARTIAEPIVSTLVR